MIKLLFLIGLIVVGIYLERKYSPRVSVEGKDVFFHYTAAKGVRNKVKWFSL